MSCCIAWPDRALSSALVYNSRRGAYFGTESSSVPAIRQLPPLTYTASSAERFLQLSEEVTVQHASQLLPCFPFSMGGSSERGPLEKEWNLRAASRSHGSSMEGMGAEGTEAEGTGAALVEERPSGLEAGMEVVWGVAVHSVPEDTLVPALASREGRERCRGAVGGQVTPSGTGAGHRGTGEPATAPS